MATRSDPSVRPLTRKAFYDLTAYCRTYAAELARHDQHRVNLKQCHRFNSWLAELKTYDKLSHISLNHLVQHAPLLMVLGFLS